MPGMYADGEYDLAGFCVGIVEKDSIAVLVLAAMGLMRSTSVLPASISTPALL
jgi:hypothetical protein